jgi:hypothetical protein
VGEGETREEDERVERRTTTSTSGRYLRSPKPFRRERRRLNALAETRTRRATEETRRVRRWVSPKLRSGLRQYVTSRGRKQNALCQQERDLLDHARRSAVNLHKTRFEPKDGDGLSHEDDESDGSHEAAKKSLQE